MIEYKDLTPQEKRTFNIIDRYLTDLNKNSMIRIIQLLINKYQFIQ